MKNLFFVALIVMGFTSIKAQDKYFTKDASINFDATAKSSPETIAGKSTTGSSVIDGATGNMEFAVLI
ncbi:MAG: hypothetical protein JNK41_05645, partial [Saprospiraceae bacterium]|nr:hypothetical protein [Saprospiraceae bacterium]